MQKAQTGLFCGYAADPLERIATAGFATFSVAPNGYKNWIALRKSEKRVVQLLHQLFQPFFNFIVKGALSTSILFQFCKTTALSYLEAIS